MDKVIGTFSLTGETSLAIYDVSLLTEGACAIVFLNEGGTLIYNLFSDIEAVENIPYVISPLVSSDNKNWQLISIIEGTEGILDVEGISIDLSGSANASYRYYEPEVIHDIAMNGTSNVSYNYYTPVIWLDIDISANSNVISDTSDATIFNWFKIISQSNTLTESIGIMDVVIGEEAEPAIPEMLDLTAFNPNPSGLSSPDLYGYTLAITNTHYLVSSYKESDNEGESSGKVYLYDRSTGNLIQTFDNPNPYGPSTEDYFGKDVDLNDTYCIIGAHGEDQAEGGGSGKAYIYNLSDGTLVHTLENPNAYSTPGYDYFGQSVAINDTYCLVGAYGEDDVNGQQSGAAYLFDIESGNLLHTFINPNTHWLHQYDWFGYTIDISDKYIGISAHGEERSYEPFSDKSGIVYIYDVETRELLHTLENPKSGSTIEDRFGYQMEISDKYCVAASHQGYNADRTESGKVYIFSSETGELLHTLNDNNEFGGTIHDWWGLTVATNDDFCLVGQYRDDTAAGSVHIFRTSTGEHVKTIDNPNLYGGSNDDAFGWSVEISKDNWFITSSQYEDSQDGFKLPQVYIYRPEIGINLSMTGKSTTTSNIESQVTSTPSILSYQIDNPDPIDVRYDQFGTALAINDSYFVVGTYLEDDEEGTSSGKIYIYNKETRELLHTIDNPNPYGTSEDDWFGYSLAINDTHCITGAHGEDEASGLQSGKVYVFELVTGNLVHTIDNPNIFGTTEEDRFGKRLALTNNYCAVSGYNEDDEEGTDSGVVYIFNPTTWSLIRTINNPNPHGTSVNDYFGFSIDITDLYCLVGAYYEDYDGTQTGMAYIFDITTGSLLHSLYNPNAEGYPTDDKFGYVVAISDTYSVIGTPYEDDADNTEVGKAYVYNNSTGTLLYTIDNPNPVKTTSGDYFALKVAINDTYCIVSAENEEAYVDNSEWEVDYTGAGYVYIYRSSDGTLLRSIENPNPSGTNRDDRFGSQIEISADNWIIASARLEDGGGVSGVDQGKVYLYKLL